jgi:hypothetical protein
MTMSEFLDAEIHETIDHLELRWKHEDKTYGLVITPEMYDLLALDGGDTPILARIITYAEAWTNRGLSVRKDGFALE